MVTNRDALPQSSAELFLGGGGLETDLIFNRGIDLEHFAAHTLLRDQAGRQVLRDVSDPFHVSELLNQYWSSGMGWSKSRVLPPCR